MASLAGLAVQCSVPFALSILLDEGARWRGPFAAFYVASLVGLGFYAAGPENLAAFVEAFSRAADPDLAF